MGAGPPSGCSDWGTPILSAEFILSRVGSARGGGKVTMFNNSFRRINNENHPAVKIKTKNM